ncbi:MAG: cobalt ECF transporter T component CbiQ [Desulfamplus sp.]|nr:cobalt ECF transporter T component CbiQ [Desulfamplus sp.]MBF0388731.1 cobalt ECF transporter T component CbiQ [Desulfamplus sp.]
MSNLQNNLFDIFYIDTLACRQSWIHSLDPRAKVLTTLIFVGIVVSFDKYEIAMLIPFFIYPAVAIALADLPFVYLAKKMLLLLPFAFFIGIFNPLMDNKTLITFDLKDIVDLMEFIGFKENIGKMGTIDISGGWVSFLSIMIRFCLTVGAALILISTTGFDAVCLALQRFGVPRPFIVQLMFLYRYMFVLIDEASRMVRARSLRTFDNSNQMRFGIFISMVGQLLLRTMDRAQRIHLAMCCRGFEGDIQMLRAINFGVPETLFTAGWTSLFVILRLYNIPVKLGMMIENLLLS